MKLKKSEYTFLNQVLDQQVHQDVITKDQYVTIMDQYSIKKMNQTFIISLFGSILVSLGIMFYIAGNWSNLTNFSRLFTVVGLYIAFFLMSIVIEKRDFEFSRVILLLSSLVFLIGMIPVVNSFYYQFAAEITFLIAIGFLILHSLFYKYRIYFISFSVLSFISLYYLMINSLEFQKSIFHHGFLLGLVTFMVVFFGTYLLNQRSIGKNINLFFLPAFTTMFVIYLGSTFNIDLLYITVPLFLITLFLLNFKLPRNEFIVISIQIISGILGFVLTFDTIWNEVFRLEHLNIVFSILFGIYLIYRIFKREIVSIVILAAVIFRFTLEYAANNSLLTSFVFILLGLVLIGVIVFFKKLGDKNA